MLQLGYGDDGAQYISINVHGVYNPPLSSHNKTNEKGSLPEVRQALRMPGESITVGDFNLHHPSWAGPSYLRQHLPSDDLLNIMRIAGGSLTLPQDIIIRDCQGSKTIIDLIIL